MVGGPILASAVMFGLEGMPFYKDLVQETMIERDKGNKAFQNPDGTMWTNEQIFLRSQVPAIAYASIASVLEVASMSYITKGVFQKYFKSCK